MKSSGVLCNGALRRAQKTLKKIWSLWLLTKMGRITYVCATCSEHFTKKYSAARHNLTLHNGRGEIVRLLEYLEGTLSGRYLTSHPSWYRRTQKWETPAAHKFKNEFGVATLTDSVGETFRPGNGLQQAPQGNTYKNSHYSTSPILQAMHKTVDQPYGTQSQETRLKIIELKTLLDKHYVRYVDRIGCHERICNQKFKAKIRQIIILRLNSKYCF